jgi:hypothetical protein
MERKKWRCRQQRRAFAYSSRRNWNFPIARVIFRPLLADSKKNNTHVIGIAGHKIAFPLPDAEISRHKLIFASVKWWCLYAWSKFEHKINSHARKEDA